MEGGITNNEIMNESKNKTRQIRKKNTHTQCVFHIIRLRLIIFHTPKFFNGDFHFNFFFINFFYVCIPCMKNGVNFSVYGHLIMVISGQFEMVINWGYILKSCSTYNFYVF